MFATDNISNFINTMPKIDLHCHLDGSMSPDFVRKVLDLKDDAETLSELLQAPRNCDSLVQYLTKFDLPIKCLQTKENIINAVLDVIETSHGEGVKYIELRFAPTFSVNDTLNYHDICEAAIEGLNQGKSKYDIDANIILCAMRHHDLETNLKVLRCGMEYLGHGICALDLAGDEAGFHNIHFKDLFSAAKKLGMPFTIHSGECGNAENVKLALEYGATRVGHGIALVKDDALIKLCQKSHLGLELCPTSNYQTKAILPHEPYPLKFFLDNGLLATVNTDNRTVSNTTITEELSFIGNYCGINEDDIITLYKNSVEICFADDNIKNKLIKLI